MRFFLPRETERIKVVPPEWWLYYQNSIGANSERLKLADTRLIPLGATPELKVLATDWIGCQRCPLGEKATNHVLWELPRHGHEPLDILFIGEGPGENEDLEGFPFVGRSGDILRETIADVMEESFIEDWRVGISNIVACRPTDAKGGNRPPTPVEARTCAPRLTELLRITQPALILTLGRVPENLIGWALKPETGKPLKIPNPLVYANWHPSYVLRLGGKSGNIYIEWKRRFTAAFMLAYAARKKREETP